MRVATTTGGDGDDDGGYKVTGEDRIIRKYIEGAVITYSSIAVEVFCTSTESDVGDGSGPYRAYNAETV